MYQPSSAVACQSPLARLPIYPDISQLQRKSVLNRKFYLLIILWIPQIINPIHSALDLTLFHFPKQYREVKDKFISGA